jgi:hypothetical protein
VNVIRRGERRIVIVRREGVWYGRKEGLNSVRKEGIL